MESLEFYCQQVKFSQWDTVVEEFVNGIDESCNLNEASFLETEKTTIVPNNYLPIIVNIEETRLATRIGLGDETVEIERALHRVVIPKREARQREDGRSMVGRELWDGSKVGRRTDDIRGTLACATRRPAGNLPGQLIICRFQRINRTMPHRVVYKGGFLDIDIIVNVVFAERLFRIRCLLISFQINTLDQRIRQFVERRRWCKAIMIRASLSSMETWRLTFYRCALHEIFRWK